MDLGKNLEDGFLAPRGGGPFLNRSRMVQNTCLPTPPLDQDGHFRVRLRLYSQIPVRAIF